MFEGLAAYVINSYIGKYLHNINTDQISIALTHGSVQFENLPFKIERLNSLGLPVNVKAGFVGKVKISIPVTNINSPWTVSLSEICLLTIPLDEKSDMIEKLDKQMLLDEMEAAFHRGAYSASWFSMGAFGASIVENLQLFVNEVNIRHEIPSKNIALGIKLSGLEVQTANSDWTPGFATSGDMSYKVFKISGFSAYIDEQPNLLYDSLDSNFNLIELFKVLNPSGCFIENFDFKLLTKRCLSENALRSKQIPRIEVSIVFEALNVTISSRQLLHLLRIIDDLERSTSRRPKFSIKENPRAWWKYVLSSIVITRVNISSRLADLAWYIKNYRSHLQGTPVTDMERFVRIEAEWETEVIIIVRKAIMGKIIAARPQKSGGWFSWLGTYSSSRQASEEIDQLKSKLSDTASTLNREDVLYCRIKFNLASCTFKVEYSNDFLALNLNKLNVRVEYCARKSQARKITVELRNLSVYNRASGKINNLLTRRKKGNTEDLSLFSATLDSCQQRRGKDYGLKVSLKPVDIFFNQEIIQNLNRFLAQFEAERRIDFHAQYERIKNRTRDELLKAVGEQNKTLTNTFRIDLDLEAPKIVFPIIENTKIIIDLGHISFYNFQDKLKLQTNNSQYWDANEFSSDEFETPDSSFSDNSEPMNLVEEEVLKCFYNQYWFELDNMSILAGSVDDNWKSLEYDSNSNLHLLHKLSLKILLERCTVISNDIPNLKMAVLVPKVALNIDQSKIAAIWNLFSDVKKQSSKPKEPNSNLNKSVRFITLSLKVEDINVIISNKIVFLGKLSLTNLSSDFIVRNSGIEIDSHLSGISFKDSHYEHEGFLFSSKPYVDEIKFNPLQGPNECLHLKISKCEANINAYLSVIRIDCIVECNSFFQLCDWLKEIRDHLKFSQIKSVQSAENIGTKNSKVACFDSTFGMLNIVFLKMDSGKLHKISTISVHELQIKSLKHCTEINVSQFNIIDHISLESYDPLSALSIASCRNHKAIAFKLETTKEPMDTSKMFLSLSTAYINFNGSFWYKLFACLRQFSRGESRIREHVKSVSKSITKNVFPTVNTDNFSENSIAKWLFDIHILAPCIYIPHPFKSLVCVLDLGEICLSNYSTRTESNCVQLLLSDAKFNILMLGCFKSKPYDISEFIMSSSIAYKVIEETNINVTIVKVFNETLNSVFEISFIIGELFQMNLSNRVFETIDFAYNSFLADFPKSSSTSAPSKESNQLKMKFAQNQISNIHISIPKFNVNLETITAYMFTLSISGLDMHITAQGSFAQKASMSLSSVAILHGFGDASVLLDLSGDHSNIHCLCGYFERDLENVFIFNVVLNTITAQIHTSEFLQLINFVKHILSTRRKSKSVTDVSQAFERFYKFTIQFTKILFFLNKRSHCLALVEFSDIAALGEYSRESMNLDFSLQSMLLEDLTSYNKIYKCKFHLPNRFHFNLNIDYSALLFQPCVKLNCDSFVLIYTHRFYTDLIDYFLQFVRGLRSSTKQVTSSKPHPLVIDINVQNLDLIIPESFQNRNCAILSIQQLDFHNENNDSEHISSELEFHNVNLFEGYKESLPFFNKDNSIQCIDGCVVRKKSLLEQTFTQSIKIESYVFENAPILSISAEISSIIFSLEYSQIRLLQNCYKMNINERKSLRSKSSSTSVKKRNSRILLNVSSQELLIKGILSESNNSDVLLFTFALSSAAFTMTSFLDNSVQADLVCGELSITDSRFGSDYPHNRIPNPFFEVIGANVLDGCQRNLNFELHVQTSVDSIAIDFNLNNLRIFCIADWFFLMYRYFSVADHQREKELQPSASPTSSESSISLSEKPIGASLMHRRNYTGLGLLVGGNFERSSDHKLPSEPKEISIFNGKSLEVKCSFNNVAFVLIEELENRNTAAIVLTLSSGLSLNSKVNDISSCINITNLQVYSCNLPVKTDSRFSLLSNTNIDFEISQVPSSEKSKFAVSVAAKVSSLQVKLSYTDLLLIASIIENFSNGINQFVKNSTLRTLSSDLCPPKIEMDFSNKSSDEFSSESSREGFLGQVNLSQFSFAIAESSLCLINDSRDSSVPFLEFHLINFNATHQISSLQLLTVIATLSLDYYNVSFSGYEPLLDPWSFTLQVSKDFKNNISLHFSSMQKMDISLTSSCIKSFQMASRFWRQRQQLSSIKTRHQYIPFILKNECGQSLFYIFHSANSPSINIASLRKENPNVADWNELQSNNEILLNSEQSEIKSQYFYIQLYFSGCTSSEVITLSRKGMFWRSFSNKKGSFEIVCNIALTEKGRKLISINSSVAVVNETASCCELWFQGTVSSKLFLESNSSCSVPLSSINSCMKIRPILESKFNDEALTWRDVTNDFKDKIINCGKWNACAHITKLSSKAMLYRIILRPAIVFENLLPRSISIVIGGVLVNTPEGDTSRIHNLRIESSFLFSIKLPGFRHEQTVLRSSPALRCCLTDNQGRFLHLLLRCKTTLGGTFKMSLSAPFWFVNKTPLPLILHDEDTGKDVAGPQPDPILFGCRGRCLVFLEKSNCELPLIPGAAGTLDLFLGNGLEQCVCYRVTRGNARYQDTSIITISPRCRFVNQCKFPIVITWDLSVAMTTAFLIDSVTLKPNESYIWLRSSLKFCMKNVNSNSVWTCPIRFNQAISFDVGLRTQPFSTQRVHVQVNFGVVTLSEGDEIPPPYVIENASLLDLEVFQECFSSRPSHKTTVHAKSTVNYFLDDISASRVLQCAVSGSSPILIDLEDETFGPTIRYESFFVLYVNSKAHPNSFVLDVDGRNVVIRKRDELRSTQLWKFSENNVLIHEASSLRSSDNLFALDVVNINRNETSLVVKPYSNRSTSQQWTFSETGGLANKYNGWYVKILDDHIAEGNRLYLSMNATSNYTRFVKNSLRPGNGRLSTAVLRSGLTRILKVYHEHEDSPSLHNEPNTSVSVKVDLKKGIGFSLVNLFEELCYGEIQKVLLNLDLNKTSIKAQIILDYVQLDNQLRDSNSDCIIQTQSRPAFTGEISIIRQKSCSNLILISNIDINIAPFSLCIDELLLLNILQLTSPQLSNELHWENDETIVEKHKVLIDHLSIKPVELNLSCHRAKALPDDLLSLRQNLNIRLVQLEDAKIALATFSSHREMGIIPVLHHYANQIRQQAFQILGAVDLLGNPSKLFSDVTMSVSSLVDNDFSSFLQHLTHGLSSSAAKVAGSLSDEVASRLCDSDFQQSRKEVLGKSNTSLDHVVSGVLGLTYGVCSGISGLLVKPVEGLTESGISGLVSGLGSGLLGSITKPATGVLDLASGTASAIRNTAGLQKDSIGKLRLPRCCSGIGNLLTSYSEPYAQGREILNELNGGESEEKLLFMANIDPTPGRFVRLMISTHKLRLMRSVIIQSNSLFLDVLLDEIVSVEVNTATGNALIGLNLKGGEKRVVNCHSVSLAEQVKSHIEYAKHLKYESFYSVTS